LSFFDDDDEPRRTTRRAARPASRPRRAPDDPQAIRRRQLVALGAGIVLLILIVLGIRQCAGDAAKQGLRDYTRAISGIDQKSVRNVGRPLFSLLGSVGSGASGRAVEVQNQLNNLKVEADDELSRTQNLDVPSEVTEAQRDALLALELRRDGVARIARNIQPALSGTDGGAAAKRIAGEMRAFDASDVLWSQRVVPLVVQALQSKGIAVGPTGETIAHPDFVRAPWLSVDYTAQQLGGGGANPSGPAKPGTHGHGLLGVSVGQQTLSPGVVNRIPASSTLIFNVRIQNQGENDESGVRVKITLSGAGTPAITATKTLTTTTRGSTATAAIPLARKPPQGTVLTLKAEVQPVPGEKNTDNNAQTFQVLFTR
jgi:hypothetical protein